MWVARWLAKHNWLRDVRRKALDTLLVLGPVAMTIAAADLEREIDAFDLVFQVTLCQSHTELSKAILKRHKSLRVIIMHLVPSEPLRIEAADGR